MENKQQHAPIGAPRRVTVVAALLWRDGSVLVQQRSAGGTRPLLWEFPGGKVEAGETEAAALIRECQEEMGVSVRVGPLAWQTEHAYPDLVVHLRLYHAGVSAQATPQALQAKCLAWLAPHDLAVLPFCAADIPLVDDLVHGRLAAVEVSC